MRRLVFVALLCSIAWPAVAQETASPAASEIPEAPVRYDTDVLSADFHQSRRDSVLQALPEDGVALFFSAPERNRENDVDFEYRQDSDLYYLTGTHEPGSVLLLAPAGFEVDGETVTELLLVPPRNAMSEVWLGRRYGPERAEAQLGIGRAASNERYAEILTKLFDEGRRFYHLPLPEGLDEGSELADQIALFEERAAPLEIEGNYMVQAATRYMLGADSAERFDEVKPVLAGRIDPSAFEEGSVLRDAYEAFVGAETYDEWAAWRAEHIDARFANSTLLQGLLTRLRTVKADEELRLLQRAIDITVAAHREAMKSLEPGMYEYEIEALIEYVFKRQGAEYTGFPSIVGSGENSTVLHYVTSRRQMEADDVVVIDIGAEYRGYTADVTRTLPVDGTFSPEQKAIYELVLKAQQAGIEAAEAGADFRAPGQAANRVVAEGLRELGLIQTEADVRNFFMHGTSHYLGLYVHDVGPGGTLLPGTVITVEPGIYISPSPEVDPKWWNIGVRIEDDILISEDGPVNMSDAAPRAVAEIEALMQERGLGNEQVEMIGAKAKESTTEGGE